MGAKWRLWKLLIILVAASASLVLISKPQEKYYNLPRQSSGVFVNHNLFKADYDKMYNTFKVYVYPQASDVKHPFSSVFLPFEDPYNPKTGNYFSEHMFKINLLNSSYLTDNPREANLFFLPFSINVMRYDARIRKEVNISKFVSGYIREVSTRFGFWNRTRGADHFYASCHSVGRDAASDCLELQRNAIQVTCSANYYHKFYVPHKDVSMPQVWPRPASATVVTPRDKRYLAFFAGRTQNSRARQLLLKFWSGDPDIRIYDGLVKGSYEEAFKSHKFCLHVKGYEVNTARVADAIHYGCVPVIISDQYDLPFSNVLEWKRFSVIVRTIDIPSLKSILEGITDREYATLLSSVQQVKQHFTWHSSPEKYDAFHMTMYQLWLRRHVPRPPFIQ